jgi:aryl-alcohol dehydrogenase-like predicted oxidoreductase
MSGMRVGTDGLELGLGTIGLGRPWPSPDAAVPTEEAVHDLLAAAVDLGVRLVDTAPAYGTSEARVGTFLASLPDDARSGLVVCTKVGERWSSAAGSVVDHSPDACRRSLDRSLRLLGRIDLLQLHKCSVEVVTDDALVGWLVGLRDQGVVGAVGASVSDPAALRAALDLGVLDAVQLPANPGRPALVDLVAEHGGATTALLNRPFGSGALAPGPDAFAWLRSRLARGVVLTGTTSGQHLSQNLAWLGSVT